MGFWLVFAYWAASMAVGELLRPKQQIDNAKPPGRGDFDFPTATEARCVGVVCGTVELNAPNVTWWGDLSFVPIKKAAGKGGFMGTGSTKWQIVGWRVHSGMHLSFCHGPVELLELKADGRSFWTGVSNGGVFTVAAEDLFGGEDSGGGVSAQVAFLPGSMTQAADPYLQSQLGSPLPAWRGQASLVWYGPSRTVGQSPSGYLGTNPRIAPISPVVRRIPSSLGLSSAITNLQGDGNAAEFIYESIINDEWGMGEPLDLVDAPSFIACAQQLATEGFGISLNWDSGQPIGKIWDEILRTVDGACYQDFRTGKWTMKLARGGYDINTLPVLDETAILSLENYSCTAMDETTNEVKVTYLSRTAGFKDRQVQAQDFANIRYQDAVVSQTMNYPMITRDDLAARVAARDLFALSTPLAKCDIVANRKGYLMSPGDVFVLRWGPLGLDHLVMRVQKATPGNLTNGDVRLSCIQDVFALGQAIYAAPPASGWVDPVTAPQPCQAQALVEAPYWLVGEARYVLAMGARADKLTVGADIWTDEGAGYLLTGAMSMMTPYGILSSPYSCKTAALDTTGFTVGGGADLAMLVGLSTNADGRNRGANLAWFEGTGEWVSWTTCTDNGNGTYTFSGVLRGVLDSVPCDQVTNGKVWFLTVGAATTRSSGAGDKGEPGATGASVTGPSGRGYIWHGAWDSTHLYAVDDTCSFNGSTWVSILGGINHPPDVSPTYWNLMAQKGTDGAGGGSGVPTDWISGLSLTWVSGSAITLEKGSCWIPGAAAVLNVATPIAKTGLVGLTANTWYHVYVYDNLGTPDIEISATAPSTAYQGTACTKNGNTSRRYVGSVWVDGTPAIPRFYQIISGNMIEQQCYYRVASGDSTDQATVSYSLIPVLIGPPIKYALMSVIFSPCQGEWVVVRVGQDLDVNGNDVALPRIYFADGVGFTAYSGSVNAFTQTRLYIASGNSNMRWWRRTYYGTIRPLYLDINQVGIAR